MSNSGIIFYILSLFLIASVNGRATGSLDFDVLIFTQHWPQTVCYTWQESSESHVCHLPKDRDEWTIHGLWPSQYHKLGPQFCNKSMPFDLTALKPLEEQLKEKWIDIEFGTTSSSLWEHEWDKHGTCSLVLPPLDSEVKYFETTLQLLETYDMKHVLAKGGILPGQKYPAQKILKAVERVLGKRGTLQCRKNKNTGESYMFELRICFDKTLQLVDCDGVYGYPTNCDNSVLVTYPDEVPHMYNVVQV
ncbi:ribonuclease Oy [Ceratina calcarata]|uniref:Ribonuclease Oy n=1 Tax=Ceratina calcarata TaxID=156304 RepID=A0AAJ7IWS8_9HYME|nr:ribonuclease Oy [Ceratina calcarata]